MADNTFLLQFCPPGILKCTFVGIWNEFTIEVDQFETLASLKKQIHANGRSRRTTFDENADNGNGIMYLYLAKRRGKWMTISDPMLAAKHQRHVPDDIEDVVCDANLLDDETVAHTDLHTFPPDALHFVIVYPFQSDEVAVSTWTPPVAMAGQGVEPIQFATVQAPATCKCCEEERTPIFTTDVVAGVFVKFERPNDGSDTVVVTRIQTDHIDAASVVAISYAWGTLPHDQLVTVLVTDIVQTETTVETETEPEIETALGTLQLQSEQKQVTIKLSSEWDADKFVGTLIALSRDAWVWIDQLCLPQSGELSLVLATSNAAIYSSCRVCCLVATLPCDGYDALQREAAALYASRQPEEVTARLEAHMEVCACTANWNVYFSRIWPWQEFAISTKIEFHTGLGAYNLAPVGVRLQTLMTAANQAAVKLADRLWGGTFETYSRDNHEAATLLVLGWGVSATPRKKISTIDTLCFLSWLARSQRTATKLLDIFFAVTPLLELASDFQISSAMTVREALVALMTAFQIRNLMCLTGAVPVGLFGASKYAYKMGLTQFDFAFDLMRNTYDFLPFVAMTNNLRTVRGVVRGYSVPRTVTTLLRHGQAHRASLRDIVRSMSRAQKEQAKEFGRGSLCKQLGALHRAVAGALAGSMDGLFAVADMDIAPGGELSVAEYNRTLFRTVAVVLGIVPFHAMNLAESLTNDAALGWVHLTYHETGLVLFNEQSRTDHVCISGDAAFVGSMTPDGKSFRVTGTVVGSFPSSHLLAYELVQDKAFSNSIVIA